MNKEWVARAMELADEHALQRAHRVNSTWQGSVDRSRAALEAHLNAAQERILGLEEEAEQLSKLVQTLDAKCAEYEELQSNPAQALRQQPEATCEGQTQRALVAAIAQQPRQEAAEASRPNDPKD